MTWIPKGRDLPVHPHGRAGRVTSIFILIAVCIASATGCSMRPKAPSASPAVPSLRQALAAKTDVWGEAALAQPGGPSYAFFRDLLPPLRYVTASFFHYPIILSAPGAPAKVRLVSNGSAVNALGRTNNWINETGIPATIRVGSQMEAFGSDLNRLDGPKLEQGYLPIVRLRYQHAGATFTEECFASVHPAQADQGVAFLRVGVAAAPAGQKQKVEIWFDGDFPSDVRPAQDSAARKPGSILNADGKVIASFDNRWEYTRARSVLSAFLLPGESACVAIYTIPAEKSAAPSITDDLYELQRRMCIERWEQILARGIQVRVPEDVVNNAWRAALIANYEILKGDRMLYSAGNQYAGLYVGEGGDTARAFALWGHEMTARQVMPTLFNFTRPGLEYHQAGFKLQMLAHVYRLTRDAEFVRRTRPQWERELNVILSGRDPATGLFPPEKYAGDLAERVPSLNSNANAWRALRDMSAVLEDQAASPATQPATAPATRPAAPTATGPARSMASAAARLRVYPNAFSSMSEQQLATLCGATAEEFRKVILAALDKAIDHSTTPPFFPLDLSGKEKPHDPITATSPGSYWNIMIQYVLGSGVFRYDSRYADDLLSYLRTHGGICMGMSRSSPQRTQWVQNGAAGINDLYGLRTALLQFQRDEVDRALVTFYGKLAHGFTRDTFVGCEGSSIVPLDAHGRQMYLPPNSASNAYFLWQLRYMLIQDFDLDDDGREETLRLLFATPRAWLAEGKRIEVENAPTTFGNVTLHVTSHVARGHVDAELILPPAPRALLRLRVPAGYRVTAAKVGDRKIFADESGTFDLTGFHGPITLRATIAR
jgi:hypothetical protein